MTKKDLIQDDGMGKYFTIMLNMADDDLNPYQYRLLAHFKRVCGTEGKCFQGTRGIAKVCQMSVGKVVSTRRELEKLGYIRIVERPDSTLLITIVDRMSENVARYSRRSPDEQGVHHMNTGVHEVNQRITLEEEPPKKESAPIGTGVDEKPKTERKKNPLFDTVALEVFGIAIDQSNGDGGRVGMIAAWLAGHKPKGRHAELGAISKPAAPEHIKAFVSWWNKTHANVAIPRDLTKFVEYWRQWASEVNARRVRSQAKASKTDQQTTTPPAINPAQMTEDERKAILAQLRG